MSKTLSIILTVFKVAKIVAKVIFILCIVGAIGCVASLALLPIVKMIPSELMSPDTEIHFPSVYLVCAIGALSCAAEAIVAFFAERYFGNVEKSGTPFTLEGSKECFRLGLISIIVSAAASIISGIFVAISLLISDATVTDTNLSISLSTGLFLLFISLIFKYGAEVKSENKPCEQSELTVETEIAQPKSDEPAKMHTSDEN